MKRSKNSYQHEATHLDKPDYDSKKNKGKGIVNEVGYSPEYFSAKKTILKNGEKKVHFSPKEIEELAEDYRRKHGFDPCCIHEIQRLVMPKKVKVMGEITEIEYVSMKSFVSKDARLFYHTNSAKILPWYGYSSEKGTLQHHILGGGFKVTDHGIEDDSTNNNDLPEGEFLLNLRPPNKIVGMGEIFSITYKDKKGNKKKVLLKNMILAYKKEGKFYKMYILPSNPVKLYT